MLVGEAGYGHDPDPVAQARDRLSEEEPEEVPVLQEREVSDPFFRVGYDVKVGLARRLLDAVPPWIRSRVAYSPILVIDGVCGAAGQEVGAGDGSSGPVDEGVDFGGAVFLAAVFLPVVFLAAVFFFVAFFLVVFFLGSFLM